MVREFVGPLVELSVTIVKLSLLLMQSLYSQAKIIKSVILQYNNEFDIDSLELNTISVFALPKFTRRLTFSFFKAQILSLAKRADYMYMATCTT